ncbi:MAG: rhamnan synthesis F family protein, partial [Rhodospirillaceae bacterium]
MSAGKFEADAAGTQGQFPRASIDSAVREPGLGFAARAQPAVNHTLALTDEVRELRTKLRAAVDETEQTLQQRDARIRAAEALARSLELQLAARDQELRDILTSTSWRITRPLRQARRLRQRAILLCKIAAAKAYRRAPLPAAAKRRILECAFRLAAPLFRGTNTYRVWKGGGFPAHSPREVALPAEVDHSLAVPFGYRGTFDPPRLAVLCHLYHASAAQEFRGYFGNIPFPCGLFITTDTDDKKAVIAAAFKDWPGPVEIRLTPNRGRDIAAKLLGFPEVYDTYEYVLHVHAKVSGHTGVLAAWRGFLLENLLGSPDIVESVFAAFNARDDIGIIAAQHFEPLRHWINWGGNFRTAERLAGRMGIDLSEKSVLDFPSGSMFWARTAALKPLLGLGLAFESFESEQGQTDGTTAHAIERLYFHACERAGLRWIKIVHLPLFAETSAVTATMAADVARFVDRSAVRLSGSGAPLPRRAPPLPASASAVLTSRLQDRA